jgi:hypothetical protein
MVSSSLYALITALPPPNPPENLQGPIIVAFNTLSSIPRVHIFIDTSGSEFEMA